MLRFTHTHPPPPPDVILRNGDGVTRLTRAQGVSGRPTSLAAEETTSSRPPCSGRVSRCGRHRPSLQVQEKGIHEGTTGKKGPGVIFKGNVKVKIF